MELWAYIIIAVVAVVIAVIIASAISRIVAGTKNPIVGLFRIYRSVFSGLFFWMKSRQEKEAFFEEVRRRLDAENEALIEEVHRRLSQIHVDSKPTTVYSTHYTSIENGDTVGIIGQLEVDLRNLNVIQFRFLTKGGSYPIYGYYRIYSIDYLLRGDRDVLTREGPKLEAHAEFKRRGFIPTRRKLRDLRWKPSSSLADALNSDLALKHSLVQEFAKPWVSLGWGGGLITFGGIDIICDVSNSCVRIKVPRSTSNKAALPDLVPSRELIKSLDRIAYHVRSKMIPY